MEVKTDTPFQGLRLFDDNREHPHPGTAFVNAYLVRLQGLDVVLIARVAVVIHRPQQVLGATAGRRTVAPPLARVVCRRLIVAPVHKRHQGGRKALVEEKRHHAVGHHAAVQVDQLVQQAGHHRGLDLRPQKQERYVTKQATDFKTNQCWQRRIK